MSKSSLSHTLDGDHTIGFNVHDAELFLTSRSRSGTRWTWDPNVRWITLDATDQPAATGNAGDGP
jgi:hypothetical protein